MVLPDAAKEDEARVWPAGAARDRSQETGIGAPHPRGSFFLPDRPGAIDRFGKNIGRPGQAPVRVDP